MPFANLIVFAGTTPNIGTTCVAFGAAWVMAQSGIGRVGYLCMNLKSSKLHRYIGFQQSGHSFDQLRADVKAGTLTPGMLGRHCHFVQPCGLSVLFGSRERERAELLDAEHVEKLLEAASQAFDYCIVDVNAYWDNAATVCGMIQAGKRIMVTTPDPSHFQEDLACWQGRMSPWFSMEQQSFHLLVTQGASNRNQYTAKEISKYCGIPLVGELPYRKEVPEYMRYGRMKELLASGMYQEELVHIARSMIGRHIGIPPNQARDASWANKVWSRMKAGFSS